MTEMFGFDVLRPPEITLFALRHISQWDNLGIRHGQAKLFGHRRENVILLFANDDLPVSPRRFVEAFNNPDAGILQIEEPLYNLPDRVLLDGSDVDNDVGSGLGLDD